MNTKWNEVQKEMNEEMSLVYVNSKRNGSFEEKLT